MTSETLLDSLERLRGTGSEFAGFLANHGPMGAEALVTLGAGDYAPAWTTRYRRARDLEPAPGPDRPLRGDEWRQATGEVRLLARGGAALPRDLAQAPWGEGLAPRWPPLPPGPAASATPGGICTPPPGPSLANAGARPDPPP